MWSEKSELPEPKFLNMSNLPKKHKTKLQVPKLDDNSVLNNTFIDCTF